ncbi:hypothetical protein BU25DRAFT_415608 [Macroventuria anomochaeta]|uniref:Uncharacterized protein n=1 Tax=Macroventuria anomochaeta TaxID=301207 RepID=A0ACB6RJJ4_9PLEO|nr:uncharacterized protein BU25DRAFT_415608 [Macroventuria anomochaeta]KAF2622080.1 hypothetical protein BU25DRAFT_415608 [Macroventuria anomochaeta]
MTSFEDLDDDVLYLILDYLYLERVTILQSLRLTSLRLKDFADAVAHRNLLLIDDEVHEQITYRLAERLTDASDKICHYVRDLRVINFQGDEKSYCLNVALIADCLSHINRLDSFSWSCDAPISPRILDVLQQCFPRAQLCANVRLVDQTLFSTAQLHRLEISVPCTDLSGADSISLFRSLKQALLQLSGLRHLLLDTHRDVNTDRMEGAVIGCLQVPFEPGDRMPSLVSLKLRSRSYAFDEDHCKRLLASMDNEKLQHLTLGSQNPTNFFKVFLGSLPHLTNLEISYASLKDDSSHLRLKACSEFVAALASLRELVLRCDDLDLRADFPKMLTDVHGPNLRHLSLQARQEHIEGPVYCGNIRKFLWKFSNLRSLDMDFPDIRSYHRCPDCEGYQWGESNHFSFVPPLPSLRNVQLSIRAPFSECSLFMYVNKHAHCAICHLWTTFVDQPDSGLETLSIRFWRWESGRETRLRELIYDTTRLRGRLTVKVRHHREVPAVVYKEVWEKRWDRRVLVAFEV